jgi:hypothetical protein
MRQQLSIKEQFSRGNAPSRRGQSRAPGLPGSAWPLAVPSAALRCGVQIYHNGAGGAGRRGVAPLVVEDETGGYSRPMSDKLTVLLERLKAHQRYLILAMAEHDGMPVGSALRQVGLENVIVAVEAVADEEARRQ